MVSRKAPAEQTRRQTVSRGQALSWREIIWTHMYMNLLAGHSSLSCPGHLHVSQHAAHVSSLYARQAQLLSAP